MTLRRAGSTLAGLNVAVLGANGVFGRHLTPRLVAAGAVTRCIVRRPEAAALALACGADVRVADIFDRKALIAAVEGCDVCVNLATSLPGPSGRGDYATNDRVRAEGAPNLIAACQEAGVPRLLQQSIAMMGAAGDEFADETTVFEPIGDDLTSKAIRASLAMESSVKASGLDWVILRGALFYGPGTGFDDAWFSRATAGKLQLPGDGDAFVSLVHIADMANAAMAALGRWPSKQTLIIADDEPTRWRDLFSYIAQVTGGPPPEGGGRTGFASFRLTNARAKETLGWSPTYRDFRVGLVR